MGQGLGYLIALGLFIAFIIYIVLPVLGIIISIALLLAVAMTLVASLSGIYVGIKNFIKTFNKARQDAKIKPSSTVAKRLLSYLYEEQPAYLNYMYDAGWFVTREVGVNVWTPTVVDAGTWFSRGKKWQIEAPSKNKLIHLWLISLAIGAYLGGVFHYLAAFFLVSIFMLLQFTFLILAVIFTSILMLFLGAGTWLYSRYYRIYHRCPDCHTQMPIPIHICPKCLNRHSRLWPSAYGIFHHRCEGKLSSGYTCNEVLPTLKFIGQDKLVKRCPSCDRVLEGLGGTNIHIPIVGGPAVGKSHYIVMATMELIDKYARSKGLEITLPDTKHRQDYQANVKLIQAGTRLSKTSNADDSAKAYNLQIKQPGKPVPKLLYLYDAAGEYFTSNDSAQQQKYFQYVHGVLLIVDPFSIEMVFRAYEPQLTSTPGIISPSKENLDTVYDNMLMLFETKFKIKRNQRLRCPLAVVVTKSDAFDLEEKIGEPAALKYKMTHPKVINSGDAINIVVEEFLTNYGAGNFVRNLRNHFSKVKFFSCSAVGTGNNSEDASSFEGVRVLEPLSWLMEQI